jgi:uncharacterized membrane protein
MSETTLDRPPALEELPATQDRVAVGAARLEPLDALRGLIMIVMALDHANFFVARAHSPGEFWDEPLPRYADALAFLTRFVTHLSAPGFFFLMGVGMVLFAGSRRGLGWSEGAITRHFVVRGALLIALQLLIEDPAWQLGESFRLLPLYLGVLYGLGAAMIAGALLRGLPTAALAGLGLLALLGTELLLPSSGAVSPLLALLLAPGVSEPLVVYYPLIPWLGLTAFGMVFGRWLMHDPKQAYQRALVIGAAFIVLFLIVRGAGGIGNIRPAEGPGWIAFLNVVKYPPSIAFVLLTLGADLLLLGLLAGAGAGLGLWGRPMLVFGRSPLFFYLAHLYLYGAMGLIVGPHGIGIARMYPYWLAGLLILYPLCRLYGKFKHSRPAGSLWRFL